MDVGPLPRTTTEQKVHEVKVVLTFEVTGTEDEAWAIAEGLEAGARKKGYLAASSYVQMEEVDRAEVLGPEGNAPTSSAVTMERRPDGSIPMSVGPVTLGDDDGRSIN